jgi:hypothetical protein
MKDIQDMLSKAQRQDGERPVQEYFQKLKKAHCTYLVRTVRQKCSPLMIDNDETIDEMVAELRDLVHQVFDKAMSLHAQQPKIELCFLKSMAQSNFQLGQPSFKPHPALKLWRTRKILTRMLRKLGFLEEG